MGDGAEFSVSEPWSFGWEGFGSPRISVQAGSGTDAAIIRGGEVIIGDTEAALEVTTGELLITSSTRFRSESQVMVADNAVLRIGSQSIHHFH